jgi:hypothetical protein
MSEPLKHELVGSTVRGEELAGNAKSGIAGDLQNGLAGTPRTELNGDPMERFEMDVPGEKKLGGKTVEVRPVEVHELEAPLHTRPD